MLLSPMLTDWQNQYRDKYLNIFPMVVEYFNKVGEELILYRNQGKEIRINREFLAIMKVLGTMHYDSHCQFTKNSSSGTEFTRYLVDAGNIAGELFGVESIKADDYFERIHKTVIEGSSSTIFAYHTYEEELYLILCERADTKDGR